MLQTQAVDPPLLELLTKLMGVSGFKNFVLVGGTALALQEGHRRSIDVDLFGRLPDGKARRRRKKTNAQFL